MNIEIEAKFQVSDFRLLRGMLAQHQALPEGEHLETNTYFDTPDHALRDADKGVRLRVTRDLSGVAPAQAIMTFKGPRRPSAFKSRQEIEFTVGDAANAAALLEALGLAPVLTFQKRRQSWLLHGCKVELDELPLLGCFTEIEGSDETAIANVAALLCLSGQPSITNSYIALLLEHLSRLGSDERTILFPSA